MEDGAICHGIIKKIKNENEEKSLYHSLSVHFTFAMEMISTEFTNCLYLGE